MKWMLSLGITTVVLSQSVFAGPPVTLSAPSPAIAASYSASSSHVITYTISNYTPQYLPLSISGVSSPLQRVQVTGDCGNGLPAGNPKNPATCQIGISITPTISEANTSINQNLLVNYGGRTPLSSTIATTVNNASYIFVTTIPYSGNLGGVSGADNICQTQAYQVGSLIPSGFVFKSLLVSQSRFPCDATGACGGAHAVDWPLVAGQGFLNPDNSFFNQVNSNYVFDGSATSLMTPLGVSDNSSFIWNGVQSVLSNASGNKIVAWAYDDVNPSQDGTEYTANFATCNNWSSHSFSNNGSVGKLGKSSGVFGTVSGTTWGNYYNFNNSENGYLFNIWVASDFYSCDVTRRLVCVSN